MGTDKRERQKQGRQARVAAAEAAQRRSQGRRRVITAVAVVAAVVVVVGGVALFLRRDDSSDVAASTSTTTTVASSGSAAGKPCVPLADPLPAGAPDVPITPGPPPSTMETRDLVVGTGTTVPNDPTTEVTVQYIGVSCSTGKIFDSSWSRGGTPATFPLNGVIKGWTEGIPGMQVGGQRLLVLPPDVAYGAQGRPPSIAPDETLYFVVDLVSVGGAQG